MILITENQEHLYYNYSCMKTSKLNIILWLLASILISFLIVMIILINTYFVISDNHKIILLILLSLVIVFNICLAFSAYFAIKKRRENIKQSYDFYVENMINTTGIGVIIFNSDGEVI